MFLLSLCFLSCKQGINTRLYILRLLRGLTKIIHAQHLVQILTSARHAGGSGGLCSLQKGWGWVDRQNCPRSPSLQ